METVTFSVVGLPRAMGSAKAVPTNRNWRTVPGVRWRVVKEGNDSKEIEKWQDTIRSVAAPAMKGADPIEKDAALVLQITFCLPRPASVKREHPTVAPDLDKLVRAAGDALTGIVWVDDSQIVNLHAWKRYGKPGATITVSRIGAS
jgi:Holliday junction resolvase RusA-like endonuclease